MLSLICATVIFSVSRVCGKSCFVKMQFFCVRVCSVYLNHSMMGGFDVQLTYYFNYPRFAKITDSRGKASNALASPITFNHIHKSTRMLRLPLSLCYEYLSAWCIWLYVLIMSRTRFRVNPHSMVVWMSRNSLLETGAKGNIQAAIECGFTLKRVFDMIRTYGHRIKMRSICIK